MIDYSQTKHYVEYFKPYLKGTGLDIGYGGRSILPTAINLDLPNFKVWHWNDPQHLYGDALNLYWFNSNTLDYVYSSHCLEDFIETEKALREWVRVLKIDGILALLLPDQPRFLAEAHRLGKGKGNAAHKHNDFSIIFVKNILKNLSVKIFKEEEFFDRQNPNDYGYNFAIVAKKI